MSNSGRTIRRTHDPVTDWILQEKPVEGGYVMKYLRLLILAVPLIAASTMILAQDEEPAYINLRVVTVKPDQLAQWESIMKERSEVVKEAGQAFFSHLRPSTWTIGHVSDHYAGNDHWRATHRSTWI